MRALPRLVSIAVDSVDSLLGGCTTHFSSIILPHIAERLADFPLLVRLNPGIPWKTRGNAAVALRLYTSSSLEKIVDIIYEAIKIYSAGSEPGVAAIEGLPWREELRRLYRRGLTGVLVKDVVEDALNRVGGVYAGGRGLIGAAAALGSLAPEDDYTFELIAYRSTEMWGKERCVRSVAEVSSVVPPTTFYNYDVATLEETVSPKGPDPVLAGFRGNCPEHLPALTLALCERVDSWLMFRTNQHTDAHAIPLTGELKPYETGTITAVVREDPLSLAGGHVVVGADVADLVFFRETDPLPEIAGTLRRGDVVQALGSVRPYRKRGAPVFAVEKLRVLKASDLSVELNPRCPLCGRRMESAGRGKGFRCDCGYYAKDAEKLRIRVRRALTGEFTPRRPAHLVKPPWRKTNRAFSLTSIDLPEVYGTDRPPAPRRVCT